MDTFDGELLLLSIATNRYLRVDAAGRILADSPGPRPDSRDGVRFRWQIKPDETSPQRPVIPQQLTFTPYHASGIYDVGETVGWTVTPGPTPPTYAYKWTIRRNNAVVLKEGTLDLSSGKDTIEIAGDQPEMIYVAVEAVRGSDRRRRRRASERCAALHRRQHRTQHRLLRRRRSRRADEDRAVDAASGRLRRVLGRASSPRRRRSRSTPVLTPVETDVPGVEMNMFELDALGSKAHGYVAKPARRGQVSGGHPAAVRRRLRAERGAPSRGAPPKAG